MPTNHSLPASQGPALEAARGASGAASDCDLILVPQADAKRAAPLKGGYGPVLAKLRAAKTFSGRRNG
jgi:hypothetical protein